MNKSIHFRNLLYKLWLPDCSNIQETIYRLSKAKDIFNTPHIYLLYIYIFYI